jgi:hypothetical protein
MYLAGQPASRPAHGLSLVAGDTGAVLVYANDGRVDHLHRRVMVGAQCIHDPVPHASSAPANEAIVVRGPKLTGRSRHGAPDRKTQKMPLRTRRSFTRGTPRGLFGRNGLMGDTINPQKPIAADANILILLPLSDHNRTCPDMLLDRLGRK